MGLSVLRMAGGLVTLVEEVNLEGDFTFGKEGKVLVWGQRAQEGVGDLLHQTGCSQRCLHPCGFWEPLKLCYTYLASC